MAAGYPFHTLSTMPAAEHVIAVAAGEERSIAAA